MGGNRCSDNQKDQSKHSSDSDREVAGGEGDGKQDQAGTKRARLRGSVEACVEVGEAQDAKRGETAKERPYHQQSG
jgi:hypothetical protein